MGLVISVKQVTFGQWLRLKRMQLSIAQADIAKALEVKNQTISSWENGKSIPNLTPEQTRVLCELLQTDLATLAKAFRGEMSIDG